jgi:hypothetical protein
MSALSNWLRSVGLKKPKPAKPPSFPYGYGEEELATHAECSKFTVTDKRRILSLIHAVRYVVRNDIPGDIVECGVFRGGSMMVVARTLLNLNHTSRDLHLLDTYEGMPAPADNDEAMVKDIDAKAMFEQHKFEGKDASAWTYSPLEEVKKNVGSVGYPADKVHYVKGKVEDTLPGAAPERIALLRLDTDFYESTRHELIHLYPRLSVGGVLLIDDYLSWRGSHEAVDEYVTENKVRILLNPIDGGGVIGVKIE